MMPIVQSYPPNYKEICQRIPAVKKNKYIIFTYGDTIYNPAGIQLRSDIIVHERVHIERQTDPVAWWSQYLVDPAFRMQEELVAYQTQYEYIVKCYNRSLRRKLLSAIASDLSGSMYGNMITKEQAIKLITREDE